MSSTAPIGPRPSGFYRNWPVFCREILSTHLRSNRNSDTAVATVILAGGAVLGATGLVALVQANKEAIAAKGKEWGVENLAAWLTGGGALVGALLGGFGGSLATRLLSKHAGDEQVTGMQGKLTHARREFEELKRDADSHRITRVEHRSAVEHLFWRATTALGS